MTKAVYVQDGEAIDYTPSSAVAAGDVIVQGTLVGVAKVPIAANALGALSTCGVFDVAKGTGEITAGAAVYWDADGNPVGGAAGSGAATGTSAGNTFMGYAVAGAASNDAKVRVCLCSQEAHAAPTALAVADASAVTFGTSKLQRSGSNVIATLPSADPGVAGALYVDGGAVKVSAGS